MTAIRTASLVLHEQAKDSMMNARNEISRLSKEITSGKKADYFSELSDKQPLEAYLNIRNSLDTIVSRSKNNELLSKKITTVDSSIRSLQDLVSDGLTLAVQAKDPASGKNLDSISLAKQQLSSIKNLMNTQFNKQYVFSGSKIDTAAMGDIVNTSNVVAGIPTANYYLGDDKKMVAKISEDNTIEYGVTGDDQAFQYLIGAYHMLIDAKTAEDPVLFAKAVDWFNQAKVDVGNIIANVANNQKVIESQVKSDTDYVLRLQENVSEIEDVDTPEAMTELLAVQTQIQAAYMLLVRVSNMSLADYIK